MKYELKQQALALRMDGFSYREIMARIPVAKSTLSDWLHSVGLSTHQKQRLTEKKLAAIRKGADAKRNQRLVATQKIFAAAAEDIGIISKRELWLMGVMLYWAEGAKQKEYHTGVGVHFTNSDPDMINLFLLWLKETFHTTPSDITVDLTIHELQRSRTEEIKDFWTNSLAATGIILTHIYYKRGNPKTKRKNIGPTYHGILTIRVKASSVLNRQIAGWANGVVHCLR